MFYKYSEWLFLYQGHSGIQQVITQPQNHFCCFRSATHIAQVYQL